MIWDHLKSPVHSSSIVLALLRAFIYSDTLAKDANMLLARVECALAKNEDTNFLKEDVLAFIEEVRSYLRASRHADEF